MENEFYVIGIGASSGGLVALTEFFDHVSADLPAAFVITTHLLREHRSILNELIAKHTTLPVVRVEQDVNIEAGKVYVLIENQELTLQGHTLRTKLRKQQALNSSVDLFFDSLAMSFKEKAIGIILSGAGKDGLHGALEIAKNGGYMMVQEPGSAQATGMPDSIIGGDHPKIQGSPKELAKALNKKLGLMQPKNNNY